MFRRRQSRSRFSSTRLLTPASIELLEDKRLLSGVNSADVPERTITITDTGLPDNTVLSIQEVHIVDDAVWVLTQTRTQPIANLWAGIDAPNRIIGVSQDVHTVSIDVNVPDDLPVVEFRIDGVEGGTATPVGGFTEFHELLQDHTSELVFSQADPELSEWRETVYEELSAEAEELYADQFGTETEGNRYWWHDWISQPGEIVVRALPNQIVSDIGSITALTDTTNVQVDGVDEADIVETDGEYIYTLHGDELVIVSVANGETPSALVSRTQLTQGHSLAMFLHEGRLTVISNDYHNSYSPFVSDIVGRDLPFASSIMPGRARTVVTVLDVSDPESPTLEQETVVDGVYQSARAIGDQVYVVVNNTDSFPYLHSPTVVQDSASTTGSRYQTREEYFSGLQQQVDKLAPPSVYHRTETVDNEQTLQRLGWLNGAADAVDLQRSQLTSVLQFDSSSSTSMPVDDIGIRTTRYSQSEIYASAGAIYLVNVEYPQAESDGDLFIVPNQNATSRITKIDISGERLTLDGTGSVAGIVESQFSLDEHNGFLRILTTTNVWTTDSENHVYILEDTGSELEIVGSILGLAPTERIYSARFDGDRAWMVTFRQVDPVFSLDLSDPTNPQVTGELKIPGFSEYLQLIDENHLLAIGRGATEEGRVLGLEVSLFDVSDMTSPELLHRRTLSDDVNSWSNSIALNDHRAFNYLPEAGLLVIPYADRDTNGVMALSIDIEDGIDIVAETNSESTGYYQRTLQIGEFLYAISYDTVSVLSIDDPTTILHEVDFDAAQDPAHDHGTLLREHLAEVRERLEIRDYIGVDGERTPQIELGDIGNLIDTVAEELLEFEFTVSDLETGSEILRRLSEQPWLPLQEDGEELLEDGTYEFIVRTRSQLLDNPEWSEWIESQIVTIGDDQSEMISASQLPELAPLLQWSEIADEVRTILEGETSSLEVNPVDRYEIWVTDALTQQMVLRDSNVEGNQFNLEDLQPGQYYSWFRAIFEDGTEAPWSARENFQIQGRPLELLNDFIRTADALPDFAWQDIQGAESFEIEITTPDGTQTLYTAAGLLEARHEITDQLTAGTYQLRVRAMLNTGVTTDWATSEFTILDRPEVHIHNRRLDLSGADAVDANLGEAVEIWVNRAETFERVFHTTEWTDATTVDLVDAFGLTNQVGEYDIWMRLVEQDGENSKWSAKQTFEVFHDAISMLPITELAVGDLQEFVWEAVDTVESYELFIQKEGQSGAFYRESGIIGDAHQLADALPQGNYKYWLRGELENGHTAWTDAFNLAIEDAPAPGIRFEDNQVVWDAVSGAVRHELWINEVDSNGNLKDSRIAHFRDLTEQTFDTSLRLNEGSHYSGWVRSFVETAAGIHETEWSDRLDFQIPQETSPFDVLQTALEETRIDEVFCVLAGC